MKGMIIHRGFGILVEFVLYGSRKEINNDNNISTLHTYQQNTTQRKTGFKKAKYIVRYTGIPKRKNIRHDTNVRTLRASDCNG